MDNIKVLVTGAGAPGISGVIYSLKKNYDNRKVEIIGADINSDVVGKYLCDKFYSIPSPDKENFIEEVVSICKKEDIDIILPLVTKELFVFSKFKKEFKKEGISVLVSDYDSIILANDKFELIKKCEKIGIPVPKYFKVNNKEDMIKYAKELGYPKNKIIVKPPVSNGMRGFRIIEKNKDIKERFYTEKPTGIYTTLDELIEILGNNFPDLLLMEYLLGKEYTVDVFRWKEHCIVIPRTRDLIRSGITFNGTIEKNDKIIELSKKLSDELNLEYAFGFQFKLDETGNPKILECNPRVQGTMVLSTFGCANIIYTSIKAALGEEIPVFNIKWGTRIMRYWGGLGILNNEVIDVISVK